MRVRLHDLVEAMELPSDEFVAYLHRASGRIYVLSGDALRAAEYNDEDLVEAAELEDARAVLAAGDDCLPLPDRFEIDEFRMMERYAASLADPSDRETVLAALGGPGSFRRFKDAIHALGRADDWYAFRESSYRAIASEWCAAFGIECDTEAADG